MARLAAHKKPWLGAACAKHTASRLQGLSPTNFLLGPTHPPSRHT